MHFSAIGIKAYGDRQSPELYPQIDEKGNFLLEQGDNSVASADFNNLLVKRESVTAYESEHGLDGKLFVTDSRIILLCENYQSGGALWIGNPVITVIASVASDAMVRSRTAGTVLTGHIRYEWIEAITPSSEKLLFNLVDETISFTYRDPFDTQWTLTVSLKNKKGLAEKVDAEISKRYTRFSQQHLHKQQQVHELPAIGATAPSDYVYCTQCGKKIRESAAFCRYCGAKQ